MRPLTVLIGIVMGSAASITFGLMAVSIVFGILALRGPHPDQTRELPQLLMSLLVFAVLTAASAGSFVGQAKERSWRGWAHAGTVFCLAAVVMFYWPRRG